MFILRVFFYWEWWNLLFDFSIIGGDDRQAYMADNLSDMNFKIITYGLKLKTTNEKIKQANSIKDALKHSKNVICPIPFTRDNVSVVSQVKNFSLLIQELKNNLNSKHRVFGGCIPDDFVKFADKRNIFLYDYMKNESFVIFNAIATAEAAIAQAILNSPINMHSSKCLVLGFGRCGKLIANKLKNLCKTVSICTRNENDRALASAYGYDTFDLFMLQRNIKDFNYIFNTIPETILKKELIENISKDAFILDITQSGADLKECLKKSINLKISLAIPGKFKPKSSADALTNLTLQIINETKSKI